jgi:hypothetical protein
MNVIRVALARRPSFADFVANNAHWFSVVGSFLMILGYEVRTIPAPYDFIVSLIGLVLVSGPAVVISNRRM